jgi:SsrA-binding protein
MKGGNKKIIASAKKRILNYQIEERLIAGLVLNGYEVKSLRNYQSSIDEAYISFQKEELYITKMHISPYKHSYESKLLGSSLLKKKRKLLLQKKEIKRLIYKLKTKNYLLVPLLLFFNQKG